MTTRNTPASFTFEEWRVEFNELATDVGDINGGITGSVPASSPTYTTVETALEGLVSDINSIINGTHEFSSSVTINGNLDVTGNIILGGNIQMGDADTDSIDFNADVISNIIPNATATYDIGASGKEWRNVYMSGALIDESGVQLTHPGAGGAIATEGFSIAIGVALG
jgi:hypothetical protein|tara:strand:+ start:4146 stop:4649 length:504 start_codon:yes stop_codon:yes gene_type:complete